MVIKLTDENLVKAIGATGAADFQDKFSAFITSAQTATKFMADSQVTLETIQKSLADLEGKIPTEASIKNICGESATSAITAWAGSEAGKKIIGAEASRITMEALAAIGTQPAKPSPAPAGGDNTPGQKAAALNAEGKYEDAWKMDKNLRAEFPSAKGYAAFMRANRAGQVKITTKEK